jgi:four helix bundle protein
LGIALKELRESRVWLKLCLKAGLVKEHKLSPLIDECSALMRILAKSILTAKANRRQEREHGS